MTTRYDNEIVIYYSCDNGEEGRTKQRVDSAGGTKEILSVIDKCREAIDLLFGGVVIRVEIFYVDGIEPSVGSPIVQGVSGAVSWGSSDLAGADLVEQEEQENSY